MKKALFLAIISILAATSFSFAFEDTWLSSNTATADTTKILCQSTSYTVGVSTIIVGGHGIFHGACVNTGAAGTLTVYNSSSTAVNPIFAMNTAAVVPCSLYDVNMSSGLVYTNSATANVTMLYSCY